MSMKTLNLQVIQWCFQLLGNRFPRVKQQQEPLAAAAVVTIKLVNSDGLQIKIYDRPIHVSELIKEFPNHLVGRSDSLYIGKKIPAISEDDQLQLGHNYFLLPKHCFQSVLSFVTITSFAANSQSQLYRLPTNQQTSSLSSSSLSRASDSINMKRALAKKMATCSQPFHMEKTQSGCLRIRISDDFIISQLIEPDRVKGMETEEDGQDGNKTGRVCTTPELHKDYAQLVGSRLTWKPKLDTIRETTTTESEKSKLKFSSSSFGMMNTRNIVVKRSSPSSSTNGNQSSSFFSLFTSKGLISRHETIPKSSKSKSKSKSKKTEKINIKSR